MIPVHTYSVMRQKAWAITIFDASYSVEFFLGTIWLSPYQGDAQPRKDIDNVLYGSYKRQNWSYWAQGNVKNLLFDYSFVYWN